MSSSVPMRGSAIEDLFATVVETSPRSWRSLATGYALQIAAMACVLVLVIAAPKVAPEVYNHIDLIAPSLDKPKAYEPPKPIRPAVIIPQPVQMTKTTPIEVPPPIIHAVAPQPKMEAAVKLPAAPPPKFDSSVEDKPAGPKVARAIQTDRFAGSSATPTLKNTPAHEVQTGGFGDPNGLRADPNAKGRPNIAALGSFDLPSGPGQGNGSGGAHGRTGTVASAGFGNGIATEGGGGGRGTGGQGRVQTTAFGSAAPAPEAPKRQVAAPSPTTPVSITAKPIPVYTEEARRLHIEGEVLLQVVFTASGELRVLSVVRGLGHGLDEAAVKAAESIRYTPAQREGQPVDSPATLHIVFQIT